jgi:hypothetical protein
MKKLTLDLDALVVESFTAGDGRGGGTVEGRDSTTDCTATESGDAFCLESAETACGPCNPTGHETCGRRCTDGGDCNGSHPNTACGGSCTWWSPPCCPLG